MLSDIIRPRIVELGKIKIGRKSDREIKSQSGHTWSPPEKIDHFLITSLMRDQKGQLAIDTVLMQQLAHDGFADKDGKIRRLPIRVLSNDPEDVMQASYVWYAGRRIGARSDGKMVTWFVGHGKDDWCKPLPEPLTEEWNESMLDLVDGKGNRLFKTHAVFNCVIASQGSKFGGVHKFRTTSQITVSQLYGGLLHILQLTGGILVGLPLQLVVRPMQVSPVGADGKHLTTVIFVVHVELVGKDLQAIQDQAMLQAKFLLQHRQSVTDSLTQYRRLLVAPGHEASDDEIADINEEFSPEHVEPTNGVPMPRAVDEQPVYPEEQAPSEETPDYVQAWQKRLDADPNIEQLNAMLAELPEDQTQRDVMWKMIREFSERAGVKWDGRARKFKV